MPSTAPTPQTWTLRIKHAKTTILLHTDPLETFTSIKSTLHTALQETTLRNPDTGATIPLPDSPSAYQLGVPVNPSEPARGFQLGAWEVSEADEGEERDEADVKGKGKAKAKAKGVGPESVKDCPKGAGLRDGTVLAVRWQGDGSGWEEEEEEEDELEGLRARKGDTWGVRLASFEDGYGVENEGDLGGGVRADGD